MGTGERTSWGRIRGGKERICRGGAVLDGSRRAGEHDSRLSDEMKDGPLEEAPSTTSLFSLIKNLPSLPILCYDRGHGHQNKP
jgi:hypothetical protein